MFDDLITWIEDHDTTVDLVKWITLVVLAWVSGAFQLLWRYRRRPRLEIAETASFVYLEHPIDCDGKPNGARASFIINASLVNASNEKIVLAHFELSFRSISFWRSHRQRLLRFAFPSRPRKQVGTGTKYMGVWFTEYPIDELQTPVIDGRLEPKETCGGYLLFSSFTYGNWNPRISKDTVHVRLRAQLTTGQRLKQAARIRITTDRAIVEEFSPRLTEHVAHDSTWNHDLSALK